VTLGLGGALLGRSVPPFTRSAAACDLTRVAFDWAMPERLTNQAKLACREGTAGSPPPSLTPLRVRYHRRRRNSGLGSGSLDRAAAVLPHRAAFARLLAFLVGLGLVDAWHRFARFPPAFAPHSRVRSGSSRAPTRRPRSRKWVPEPRHCSRLRTPLRTLSPRPTGLLPGRSSRCRRPFRLRPPNPLLRRNPSILRRPIPSSRRGRSSGR
jgi:hypothetical protein